MGYIYEYKLILDLSLVRHTVIKYSHKHQTRHMLHTQTCLQYEVLILHILELFMVSLYLQLFNYFSFLEVQNDPLT